MVFINMNFKLKAAVTLNANREYKFIYIEFSFPFIPDHFIIPYWLSIWQICY